MGTRSLGRLSVLKIKSITEPGRHCDGGGLYLQISKGGARSWIFRYQIGGRVRDMGLGSTTVFGLADAREFAGQCRRQVASERDPVEERLRAKRAKLLEQASAVTFEQCARQLIEAKRPSWRNAKHAAQWLSTLQAYAFPHFGKLAVGAVNTGLVLKALEPIWQSKNQTAGRVRERIEAVLDAAKARGWALIPILFCITFGIYCLGLWLPQMVKGLGYDNAHTGWIVMIPYAVAMAVTWGFGWSSDRSGRPALHVMLSALLAAAGFGVAAMARTDVSVIFGFSLAAAGVFACLATFWTVPPLFLGGTAAAGGFALIASIANLSGIVGPYAVGWLKQHAGDYHSGMWLCASTQILTAMLILWLGRSINAKA